jgi:sec-independent protein translocase protein TatA
MFGLGPWEILMILAIVLILFGAGRLPEALGQLKRGVAELKKGASEEPPQLGAGKDAPQPDEAHKPGAPK